MEHDPLKLFGQAADFVFVFSVLQALQAKMQSLPRNIGSRIGVTHACAELAEFSGSYIFSVSYHRAAVLGLRPSSQNSLSCALAALFGRQFGGSGRATLF